MSNKNIIWLVVGVVVIGTGIYFYMNQNSGDSTYTSTPSPAYGTPAYGTPPYGTPTPTVTPVAPQVIHNIDISGSAFVPASITVRKGETIVWTNRDPIPHTVIGGDIKSTPLGQNETYSFAFDKTGTFSYHCSIHPSMKGTITVTD